MEATPEPLDHDLTADEKALRQVQEVMGEVPLDLSQSDAALNDAQRAARRMEALQMRMMGFSYEAIGKRLRISTSHAHGIVTRALRNAERSSASELREMENQTLNRMQLAIWPKVIEGHLPSIDRALRISEHRRKMNGLDAPQQVEISLTTRYEIEQGFKELEALVLEGEIVDDDYEDTSVPEAAEEPWSVELGSHLNGSVPPPHLTDGKSDHDADDDEPPVNLVRLGTPSEREPGLEPELEPVYIQDTDITLDDDLATIMRKLA